MRKRRLFAAMLATCVLFAAAPAVYAAYELSPALGILRSKAEVKKCGVVNSPLGFSASDLDMVIGKAEYITILSLPDSASGRLTIGGKTVTAGQTVTRSGISQMIFEPKKDTSGETSFTFENAADTAAGYGVCTLYILENPNTAPVPADSAFDTPKNISLKGYLEADDPEGDSVTFSVASQPKHGTVQLTDAKTGFFMYTPKVDFTGRDVFSVRATDAYGNRSKSVRITIHVTEPESDVTFSDMTNHWAHASAVTIVADGVFSGTMRDGKLFFEPEEHVTRGDFLAVAMIAAGLEESIERVGKTPFSDDADIPVNIKSYAAAAYERGIINGFPEPDGTVSFRSANVITRAEAAAIVSRILAKTSADKIPYAALTNASHAETAQTLGVMVGAGSAETLPPDSPVTRAQTAKIYCNIRQYVKK